MKQIYGLLSNKQVMYIGCATNAKVRVKSHWKQRNSKLRFLVKDWLCTLADPPEYHVFEDVPDELAHDAEAYYTETIRAAGIKLLNVLDGRKIRHELRNKISLTVRGNITDTDREIAAQRGAQWAITLSKFCKKCGDGPFTLNGIGNHYKKEHKPG